MAETLTIRIGSRAQDAIHWLVLSSADNEIIASGELNNASELTQLTEKSQQRPVTVLVPSCDLVLKSLKVPSNSIRAMRLAVPYMLEEELAQDVEQLFFAYGDSDLQGQVQGIANDDNCFVAAVDKSLMKQWQQWLSDADITCKKMLPDVLAMPLVDNGCSAIVLDEQILLRQNAWQGMTIDFLAWPVISRQLITSAESQQSSLLINAYSSLPCGASELNIQAMPEELPLALLAQNTNKQSFNLLQGEFQYKEKRSPVLVNWLWAAGIAAFALLFNVGLKGSQLLQLNSQITVVEQEVINSYKSAFPSSKKVRINTVKSQLKRKLAQAGGGDNQSGFLAMLTKVRPAFAAVPELKPESVKFDGKRQEIRIQAIASDYQYFDKFKSEIEKTKLNVTQGAQSNQDSQVTGSFSISVQKSTKRKAKGGHS